MAETPWDAPKPVRGPDGEWHLPSPLVPPRPPELTEAELEAQEEAERAAARAICEREGHAAWTMNWLILNRSPTKQEMFEAARCSRCGERLYVPPSDEVLLAGPDDPE
jgi:hypothetical protein